MGMATEQTMNESTQRPLEPPPRHPHRCPGWAAPFMANPLRRLFESPEKLLGPWVEPGMTILDVGCATGFFSLPLAKMTGATGRVVCVDVEPRMMRGLVRRATKAGLLDRIEPIVCEEDDLGLSGHEGTIDLAVALHAIHELSDIEHGLRQVAGALKPSGRLLVVEPTGHVLRETWDFELEAARHVGLTVTRHLSLRRRYAALLEKPRSD
jgi:ubiquinone/menaquinone biosynthesis C-methylase UbiE